MRASATHNNHQWSVSGPRMEGPFLRKSAGRGSSRRHGLARRPPRTLQGSTLHSSDSQLVCQPVFCCVRERPVCVSVCSGVGKMTDSPFTSYRAPPPGQGVDGGDASRGGVSLKALTEQESVKTRKKMWLQGLRARLPRQANQIRSLAMMIRSRPARVAPHRSKVRNCAQCAAP